MYSQKKKKSLAFVYNINFTVNKQGVTLFAYLFESNTVCSLWPSLLNHAFEGVGEGE